MSKIMTTKSTQTKFFEMSDAGLDFNSGSKNLFPDRFKKMLSQGYNVQTVTGVAVVGNQVTLTYGGAHGYVPLRVMKIDDGALSGINNGEFWIDSVTTNTVTLTIEDAPLSVANGFSTRIAPIGWELVYEQAHIHVYKFKHIDDTDMYARFVFQSNMNARNTITPCIGKTFDPTTGVITDPYALADNKEAVLSTTGFRFEMSREGQSSQINQTYSAGYSSYGHAGAVGSPYHFVFSFCTASATNYQTVSAILPAQTLDYSVLAYPLIIGCQFSAASTSANFQTIDAGWAAYIGQVRVLLLPRGTALLATDNIASQGVLPGAIDQFNTVTCAPLMAWEYASKQYIGTIFGVVEPRYAANNKPSNGVAGSPRVDLEVDYNHHVVSMHMNANWLSFPLKDVKHGI